MKERCSVRAGVALGIAGGLIGLAGQDAAAKRFGEAVDVVTVQIPETAIRDGQPARDLMTLYRDECGLERTLETADQVLDMADGGDIDVAAWATPTAADASGSEVLFFLDIDGKSLLRAQRHGHARFRVLTYALDEQGSVGDSLSQRLTLDLDRVEDAIERGGVTFFGKLRLAPGRYRIRTLFQDVYTGRHGARTARVTVPAEGDRIAPSLTPLLFALNPGGGLLLVENESRDEATEYPLGSGETAYVPRSRMAVGHRIVPVMVAAYGTRIGELEAWLEDERGVRLDGLVTTTRPLTAEGDDTWRAQLEIDSAALSNGNYQLRISVRDGEITATRVATLVVDGP